MKLSGKISIVAAALFVLAGLCAVAFSSVLIFRSNSESQLREMVYTKTLEMESGLLPERKLAMQMAQSPAIVDYMETPDDESVRELAFRDFETFQRSFSSHRTFWISDSDLKYYSNMAFIYDLDKNDPGNAWYQATIDANLPFQFYVDYDLGLQKTLMWINVLVYNNNRKVTGITGTGVELNDFVNSMYRTLEPGVVMYMYNARGEISASRDLNDLEKKIPVTTQMPELTGLKSLYSDQPVIYSTLKGVYIVAPVESLGWHLVLFIPLTVKTFFENAVVPFAILVIVVVLLLIAFAIHNLFTPLKEVNSTVKNIVSGEADLTRRINTDIKTPFKSIHRIVGNFNDFIAKLQEMIGTIKASSSNLDVVSDDMRKSVSSVSDSMTNIRLSIGNVKEQIKKQSDGFDETAGVVKEVASSISNVNKMIDSQSQSIKESASAVGQLVKSIEQISASMESMAMSFGVLDQEAQSGISKQQKVNERIYQIDEQSQMLQEANTAIAAIAERTNLLAMNAAIEAAHAGEAGKGFAVVADEIRKLSETASGQSKTIGDQLKNIQDSISEIVAASQESSKAFAGVSTRIHETDNLVQSVRTSLETQNTDSRNVIVLLADMEKTTDDVRQASDVMAGGSNHVLQEMNHLQTSVNAVQSSMSEMSDNAQNVVTSGMKLDTCVEELCSNVNQLGADVKRLKTS